MRERRIHLSPRLECALKLLYGSKTVADIGCDHGRLAAALLQQNVCEHVIATDISRPSLEKAKQLLQYIGLHDRVSFRCGDGLSVLSPNEIDAIAMLGMGGTLMCEILSGAPAFQNVLVLQPMRAQSDIRSYLYAHCYWITDDRIIFEHGRYYQIFRAEPNAKPQPWPDGFPNGFFDVGYHSFTQKDANLLPYCKLQLEQHAKQWLRAKGTDGEQKLSDRIDALNRIITAISEESSWS